MTGERDGPRTQQGLANDYTTGPPFKEEDEDMMDFISFDKPSEEIESILFNDGFSHDQPNQMNHENDDGFMTNNANGVDNSPPMWNNQPQHQFVSNESYRAAQTELSSLMFGRKYGPDRPNDDLIINPTTHHHANSAEIIAQHDSNQNTNYKFQLHLGDMPAKSRVETQIKCRMVLHPTPEEHLLHLPADTIARPKFQLRDRFTASPNILHLDVDVVSQADPSKPVFMCFRCINRERKRAFRKKNLDANEEYYWNEERVRRLIIFNSKEVIPFSLSKSCDIGNNNIIQGKEIELPLRLACYCRHHSAKDGFRVIFTIKDYQGNTVARSVSKPIQITDDHKESKLPSQPPAAKSMFNWSNTSASNTGPPSPASVEESSEAFTSDHSQKSLKRRRDSDWNGSTRNSYMQQQPMTFANSRPLTATQRQSSQSSLQHMRPEIPSPQSSDNYQQMGSMNQQMGSLSASPSNSSNGPLPSIQRVIPAQGSIRGGIEVTLLGTGFHSGLSATFGDSKSMATHCWSDSTIVAQLPPAAMPGPVVVSFEGLVLNSPQIFTYVDDTDRQLIELALQVVGLKMNGKLEDARNIARRIVNPNESGHHEQNGNGISAGGASGDISHMATGGDHSFNPTSLAIDDGDHEGFIVRCIELVCLNEYGKLPHWQLKNFEGQTMMHLAAILGYTKVIIMLIAQGARIDYQDTNGMTPLHFAAMHGHRRVVRKLLRAHADPFCRTVSGENVMTLAHPRVLELLPVGMGHHEYNSENRTSSSSTLASIVSSEDGLDSRFLIHGYQSPLSVSRANSSASLMQHYESSGAEWDDGFSDSDYGFSDDDDDDALVLEDERLNIQRSELAAYSPPDNEPRNRTTAQNISHYISRLSNNARNRIHDIGSWDDVVRTFKRRRDQAHIMVPTDPDARNGSDSDCTVTPRPQTSENNISRMWHYFMPPINETQSTTSQSPPRYDEIFPEVAQPKSEKQTITNTTTTTTTPTAAAATEQSPSVQRSQSSQSLEFVEEWSKKNKNQRKEILNDKMLLFFWLPVLLLSIAFYVFKDNQTVVLYRASLQQIGERFREHLTNLLLEKHRSRNHQALTVPSSETAIILAT